MSYFASLFNRYVLALLSINVTVVVVVDDDDDDDALVTVVLLLLLLLLYYVSDNRPICSCLILR